MRLVVDYATAMQNTMEPSRVATNRAASTCRPWGKEEEEGEEEKNLSIDATVAFGNSFRILFAASASSLSLCLFLILFAIIIIIFMQFGIFFWFLFAVFPHRSLVRRCDCRRGSKFRQMNGTHNV